MNPQSDRGKIGVCVITCNRVDFFGQCIKSMEHIEADYLIVVNDGEPYPDDVYPEWVDKVIQHPKNFNVAKSKNDGLRDMMANECVHMFLVEDDITVEDPSVTNKYITAAAASGIWHLNYGGHGDGNRDGDGNIEVRERVDYDGASIDLYRNVLGAFSYYLASVVKLTGLMDERFVNAMEHVEHTYNIIKQELHPPFWWFADCADSDKMISDIGQNHEGSTIRRNQQQWEHNLKNAYGLFMHKHKTLPTTITDKSEEDVIEDINNLEKLYTKPEWIH